MDGLGVDFFTIGWYCGDAARAGFVEKGRRNETMAQNILILGASGTVGRAVFQVLSREPELHPIGTYCSADLGEDPSYVRFSLAAPTEINAILAAVQPAVVVSSGVQPPADCTRICGELSCGPRRQDDLPLLGECL